MIEHVLAFGAVFALDVLYTLYTRRCTEGRALPAATYAGLLYALGGGATLAVVHDPSVLPAACLGAFAGTWASVAWDARV